MPYLSMTCRITQKALADYRIRATCGRVVVFDTETTGISNDDEIIQLSAAEYVCGSLTRTLDLYVVPTCAIDPAAEAVHHITMPFLVEHGLPPAVALERFFAFLGHDALLVAHNIRFDFRMLRNECRKFGCAAGPEGVTFCDTIALARRLVPGLAHYRLGYLVEVLGLEGRNSHDALDDTLACGALFFELVRRIPVAGEYTYEPVGESF